MKWQLRLTAVLLIFAGVAHPAGVQEPGRKYGTLRSR
jgi:hypothetical protein